MDKQQLLEVIGVAIAHVSEIDPPRANHEAYRVLDCIRCALISHEEHLTRDAQPTVIELGPVTRGEIVRVAEGEFRVITRSGHWLPKRHPSRKGAWNRAEKLNAEAGYPLHKPGKEQADGE